MWLLGYIIAKAANYCASFQSKLLTKWVKLAISFCSYWSADVCSYTHRWNLVSNWHRIHTWLRHSILIRLVGAICRYCSTGIFCYSNLLPHMYIFILISLYKLFLSECYTVLLTAVLQAHRPGNRFFSCLWSYFELTIYFSKLYMLNYAN